eukprot:5963159-Prymnesium_polylepis.1
MQLTGLVNAANWHVDLTNSNWQLEFMLVTTVRDHFQLTVVSSPAIRPCGGGVGSAAPRPQGHAQGGVAGSGSCKTERTVRA